MNILNILRVRFSEALRDFTDQPESFLDMVRPAQDARFGDYQANFALPLGKQNGVNPRELATRIAEKTELSDLAQPIEVAGPGFLNVTIDDTWLTERINQMADDDRLAVDLPHEPRNIVVDFSSPNVAKPMHVGHLRSTVIGDALARILRFLGHSVTTDNHIGDWGTQFGMIIYGFKNFVDPAAYETDPVTELARLYRLVNQLSDYHAAVAAKPNVEQRVQQLSEALERMEQNADPHDTSNKKAVKRQRSDVAAARSELASLERTIAAVEEDETLRASAAKHPDIARKAREETAKLHQGDLENKRLWDEFLPECLKALGRVYDRLGVEFDLVLGESFYNPELEPVVKELIERELARESDGAICVFLEGNDAPFIVQKADGAFTYATTDLATVAYRIRTLKANEVLYVVDARQSEHFRMLFATVEKVIEEPPKLVHVSFGTVLGQDGRPYKTRSGDVVGLESLLDDAVAKAREVVAANDDQKTDAEGNATPELSEEMRDRIAESVGIGAIKYADLHHNRESDYVFDADKMLSLKGNTATYMQYAHARVHGIFRKGGILPGQLRQETASIRLNEPAERALALKLCQYSEALDAVAADYRPNLLTLYLFELAGTLTTFYDKCPVLKAADEETRLSRLRLVELSGRVIAHGLDLLGIEAPVQM